MKSCGATALGCEFSAEGGGATHSQRAALTQSRTWQTFFVMPS
jgi:hypothetical protein